MNSIMYRPGFLGFDVFDDFFRDAAKWNNALNKSTSGYPVTDIYTGEDGSTIVEFALAGFRKEDLKIDVQPEKRTITVSASSSNGNDSVRRIAKRSFTKTLVNYDNNLDLSAVKAKFEDGLLTVTVPKQQVAQPISVEIV